MRGRPLWPGWHGPSWFGLDRSWTPFSDLWTSVQRILDSRPKQIYVVSHVITPDCADDVRPDRAEATEDLMATWISPANGAGHRRCPWSRRRRWPQALAARRRVGHDRRHPRGPRPRDRRARGDRRRPAAFAHLDVTDDASWEAAVAATVSELGGLDILVNNAGVEITSLLVDLDADDCPPDARGQRRSAPRSASSTRFRAMRPGGPAGDGGAIVNVASVAATIAFPGIASTRRRSRRSTG